MTTWRCWNTETNHTTVWATKEEAKAHMRGDIGRWCRVQGKPGFLERILDEDRALCGLVWSSDQDSEARQSWGWEGLEA